jgi:hypothetical protein
MPGADKAMYNLQSENPLPNSDPRRPLARVEEYSRQLACGRAMASRKDFHPNDLHWLFGHFYTADVLGAGADYRFHYVGDFWKTIYCLDLTGLTLGEIEACGRLKVLRASFDAVLASGKPSYRTGSLVWPDRKVIRHERLTVPFADESGAISMLLVAAQCDRGIGELMRYIGRREPQLMLDEIIPGTA